MFGEGRRPRSLVRIAAPVAALILVALIAASPAAAASPTVTINQAAGQSDPTSGSTIDFTATFSAPVTGFTAADVDLSSSTALGTLIATVTGGPTVYTVTVSGMTGNGTVIASIPAFAALNGGHSSLTSTSTDNSIIWDPNAPLPTTPIDTPVGQPTPTDQSASSSTAQSPSTRTATPATPSLRLLSRCRAKHPCTTNRGGHALPLRVSCGAAAPCAGTLRIALGHKTLGKLNFRLAAGATTKLRVPLKHSAAPLLATRPKLAAKLKITLGASSTSSPLSFAAPH